MSVIAVAHLRVQGADFIFVPLAAGMGRLSVNDQNVVLHELRQLCRSAGLAGEVVPVWQGADGTGYLADQRYQAMLSRSLRLDFVRTNINKRLNATSTSSTLQQLSNLVDAVPSTTPAVPTATTSASARMPNASPPAANERRSLPEFNAAARRKVPNRVVTMLFSDIVGSTKLKQEYGDAQSMALINKHHAIVRQILGGTATGEEVSTSGDSFFMAFSTPSDAVLCALRWQDAIRNFAQDEGVSLQDRIGIHVGEVYVDNAKVAGKEFDLNGIQVDTAARVMSLAQGNQILLSSFAFHNAKQMLEGYEFDGIGQLSWRSYGPYDVKGVDIPVEIFEVGEAGLACMKPPPDGEKAKRHAK